MKIFTHGHRSHMNKEEVIKLNLWREEWEKLKSFLSLREEEREDSQSDEDWAALSSEERRYWQDKILGSVRPFDRKIRIGQIRVFDPDLMPPDEVPARYLGVIGSWGESFIVAPFSLMPEPATQGEIKLSMKHPRKVPMLWAAMVLPTKIIERSWVDSRLPMKEVDLSWGVFQYVLRGKALSNEAERRVGPPILQEEDCRREYQQREKRVFSKLRGEVLND